MTDVTTSPAGAAPTGAGTSHRPVLAMMEFAADGGATLGHRIVDARRPQLEVMDLSATRGDGIFETISIATGSLQALEPHLRRFAHSAALLELPPPDLDEWRDAVLDVADRAAAPSTRVSSRSCSPAASRGSDDPTGWAYAAASPDHTPARTHGIRIVLLDRGYRHDVAQTSPWLLAGAKTLSYADQPCGVPRGGAARCRRRPVRQQRRLPARGGGLESRAAHRHAHRHPAHRPRHPGGHHAGRPLPLRRGRGLRDRRTSCSPPTIWRRPTPPGWCRACGTRRRSARSTAGRSRSTATCRTR